MTYLYFSDYREKSEMTAIGMNTFYQIKISGSSVLEKDQEHIK